MAFLLLIVEPRGQRGERSEAEGRALYAQMLAFGQGLAERGLLLAAQSLKTDDHGVRVCGEGAACQLRDGPFTEAKEMVGGFYMIDVASRDEAVAIARQCPAVAWATVEVREIAPCYER